MSDGQTFYFTLLAFYLFECLCFASRGTQAFMSLKGKEWKMRRAAFRLSGLHKDAFFTHLLPWPGMTLLPNGVKDQTFRHLKKRISILRKTTGELRLYGLILFIHFFVVVPLIYRFFPDSVYVVIAVAYAYLLNVFCACMFYKLHKRYFPEAGEERFKHTLYTAILPWHAMRSADLISIRASADWKPILLLMTSEMANASELRRLYREACFSSRPLMPKGNMEGRLTEAGIEFSDWLKKPALANDEAYCPACLTIYQKGIAECSDCRDVKLKG